MSRASIIAAMAAPQNPKPHLSTTAQIQHHCCCHSSHEPSHSSTTAHRCCLLQIQHDGAIEITSSVPASQPASQPPAAPRAPIDQNNRRSSPCRAKQPSKAQLLPAILTSSPPSISVQDPSLLPPHPGRTFLSSCRTPLPAPPCDASAAPPEPVLSLTALPLDLHGL
jgi:hypothetical protein